ncbi:MAG: tetratricopeptide repeat protein, partial [bacterium]
RFHLGYDKENLYVACYVPIVPAVSRLRAEAMQSDVLEPLMRDDYVRLEIWPSADPSAGTKYGSFGLLWNAVGTHADWCLSPDGSADMKWGARSQVFTVSDGSTWVSELAIPLKSLRYGQYAATNAEGSAVLTLPPQDASTWRLRFVSKVGDASNDLTVAAVFASAADSMFRRASELFKEKQYAEAGALFEQAQQRFPYHPMAPKALVTAAQGRMKLQEWKGAIRIFSGFDAAYPKRVEDWTGATHQPAVQVARAYAEAEKARPEVLYWLGDCHAKLGDDRQAYQTWKRLTWDYPETQWAKYARGGLMDKFQAFKGEDAAVEGTNVVPRAPSKPDDSASIRDAAPVPAVREDRTTAGKASQPGETDADALLREARELQETADWAKRLNRPAIPLADLIAACRKVTERYPNTAAARKAMLDVADLQWKWGDKEQAAKSYQELAEKLANTPEGSTAFANVIDARMEKGAVAEALTMIEKYVADPKAPGRDAMLVKGVVAAYRVEDYTKSRTMAEQLIKDHPESEYARKASQELPKIYAKLGLPADTQPPKPAPRKDSPAPTISFYKPDVQDFAPPAGPTATEELAAAKDLLAKGDLVQAARRLDRIVNAKADSQIAAEALWRMAEIYRSCGNMEQAYRAYKILRWDYPGSGWAAKVPNRLVEKEFRDPEKRSNAE